VSEEANICGAGKHSILYDWKDLYTRKDKTDLVWENTEKGLSELGKIIFFATYTVIDLKNVM
jgi:hypothetical protein